jgi:hypothetical protein
VIILKLFVNTILPLYTVSMLGEYIWVDFVPSENERLSENPPPYSGSSVSKRDTREQAGGSKKSH